MNRAEMRTAVYQNLQETSTNTNFGTTNVNAALARAWEQIWKYNNIKWEWLITETILYNPCTTVASTSTETTLNATAVTNMDAGQWLYVIDGNVYERVKIDEINETIVTLVSPGLANSYAARCKVIGNHIFMPDDFYQLIDIFWENITETSQTIGKIEWKNAIEFFKDYPRINTEGDPSEYMFEDDSVIIYPLPDSDNDYRFNVRYLKKPDDLADATEPEMPERYHDLIVTFATAELCKQDGNFNKFSLYGKDFASKFKAMVNEFAPKVHEEFNMKIKYGRRR